MFSTGPDLTQAWVPSPQVLRWHSHAVTLRLGLWEQSEEDGHSARQDWG